VKALRNICGLKKRNSPAEEEEEEREEVA